MSIQLTPAPKMRSHYLSCTNSRESNMDCFFYVLLLFYTLSHKTGQQFEFTQAKNQVLLHCQFTRFMTATFFLFILLKHTNIQISSNVLQYICCQILSNKKIHISCNGLLQILLSTKDRFRYHHLLTRQILFPSGFNYVKKPERF